MAQSPQTARRATLGFAIVLLLFSALAGYAAIGLGREASLLDREAIRTTATVMLKRELPRTNHVSLARSSRIDQRPTVTYRYIVDGRPLLGTHAVDRDRFEALEIGQTVQVRYAASNPSISEIDVGWTVSNGFWAGAVSLVCAFMAAVLLLAFRRMPKPVPTP